MFTAATDIFRRVYVIELMTTWRVNRKKKKEVNRNKKKRRAKAGIRSQVEGDPKMGPMEKPRTVRLVDGGEKNSKTHCKFLASGHQDGGVAKHSAQCSLK